MAASGVSVHSRIFLAQYIRSSRASSPVTTISFCAAFQSGSCVSPCSSASSRVDDTRADRPVFFKGLACAQRAADSALKLVSRIAGHEVHGQFAPYNQLIEKPAFACGAHPIQHRQGHLPGTKLPEVEVGRQPLVPSANFGSVLGGWGKAPVAAPRNPITRGSAASVPARVMRNRSR